MTLCILSSLMRLSILHIARCDEYSGTRPRPEKPAEPILIAAQTGFLRVNFPRRKVPTHPAATNQTKSQGLPVQFWLHDEDRRLIRELAAWLAGQGERP